MLPWILSIFYFSQNLFQMRLFKKSNCKHLELNFYFFYFQMWSTKSRSKKNGLVMDLLLDSVHYGFNCLSYI